MVACRYFEQGRCNKGDTCMFEHAKETPKLRTASETAYDRHGERVVKTISGATVTFGDGAVVQSVSLRSDFSAVQISHIPLGVDAGQLTAFVTSLGFENVSSTCVRMRLIPDGSEQIAEVKVEDPSFAESFLRRVGHEARMDGRTLAVTQLQLVDAEAGPKRLQLSAVSCSWYKPSKVAWLHFESKSDALAAVKVFGERKVRERQLQVIYQEPPRHAFRTVGRVIHSVQLGNLHVDTTSRDLSDLPSGGQPKAVKWGPASYTASNKTVEMIIRRQLEGFGPLLDWEVVNDGSSVRGKATARFVNAEDARKAATQLNERKLPDLGNTKMHVSAIISVKLSVQLPILRAVQADMDALSAQAWRRHHVHIKAYDAPAHKLHTTLRIHGDDRGAVAKTKRAVEGILAGTVAADGQESAISDPFFFQTSAGGGGDFIQDVMRQHAVHIHGDAKNAVLRLYGRPAAVADAQAALARRKAELSRATHTVALTPHALGAALRGGLFKRLVETFGKDVVKIDVAGSPKTITFQGSARAFAEARAVLDANADERTLEMTTPMAALSRKNNDDDDVCAVCWTTPEDAVRRRCGHAYCRECLAGQCASAAASQGAGIPMRCLGGGGSEACGEAMALEELSDALRAPLPGGALDALLQASFASHVRARPDVFQFCPTPDCDRVYRCGAGGRTVLCDECLVDVCTTCRVAAHDGLSCAEARYLGSDEERAFETWRKEKDARNSKVVGAELAAVLPADQPPWYRQRNLLRLNFCLISLILFSSANGYDGSLMNGLQALPQWNAFMHTPTGGWLGFINAVSSIGSLFQYPVVAWAGNRFGRKPGVLAGYAFLALGVVLQTAAQNVAMFILGRFFVGCVGAWFMVTAPLLIAETAYPTHRGVLTAMFNCGWYVGSTLAAWVTFGTQSVPGSWSWRIPSLLQAGLPLLALPGYLLCPESPRWLASRGRTGDARAFFATYHAPSPPSPSPSPSSPSTTSSPSSSSPLVAFELAEIHRALALETGSSSSNSYAAMLRTPGNRRRLLISVSLGVAAQWSGVGNVSYYLPAVLATAGVTAARDQTLLNGCLQAWNLACAAFAAAWLVDRVGRRPLFLWSSGAMLGCYVAIAALTGVYDGIGGGEGRGVGTAVVPVLFLYYAAYDVAWTPLLVAYPCEIWPFALRARGVAVTVATTQAAILFNTLVNPVALEAIGWRYYIVYVVLLVGIGATCYFFYPETRGYSLEEIARVFDGEEGAGVPGGLAGGGGADDGGGLWREESAMSVVGSLEKAGAAVVREDVDADNGVLTHRRTHSV
ncbi:hypothetical protein SLS58_009893 [Diplodia intermedia]|uniref:Uncharacterized protein n=1 Tax=Diplodia intermedia TaxID=856260 RepID=A0ABR3T9H7_9PEZI